MKLNIGTALKTFPATIAACSFAAAVATAAGQPRFGVTDLGPVNSPFSQAIGVTNYGLVTGLNTVTGGAQHAVIWYNGSMLDISQPGLGGGNSQAGGANDFGQIMGQAEAKAKSDENFCGYGTGLACLPFLWQDGVMTPLATLGGANGSYGAINNWGEIAGYAENSHQDPDCRTKASVNGTGPQRFDFEAVIWDPAQGTMRELHPLPGDTVGVALGLNDLGQAVGGTGTCGNTVIPPFTETPHAVLWDADGTVHDLGSLGGTSNPDVEAVGTVAFAINNEGQVSGIAAIAGNKTALPFLWTREWGMQALPLLPGDVIGAGLGMNNQGDVVGASISAGGPASGTPSAVLWHEGKVYNLNTLASDSPLQLLTAFAINDSGVIAGFGVNTKSGDLHAFLATPCDLTPTAKACPSENVIPAVGQGDEPRAKLSPVTRKLLLEAGFGHR